MLVRIDSVLPHLADNRLSTGRGAGCASGFVVGVIGWGLVVGVGGWNHRTWSRADAVAVVAVVVAVLIVSDPRASHVRVLYVAAGRS